MKKNIIRLSVIGMGCITVLMASSVSMYATRVANEQPMAGIVLSLDKYYNIAISEQTGAARVASLDDGNMDQSSMSATNQAPVDAEAPEDSAEQKQRSIKDMISNMNFDRLGIAIVDDWLNVREKPSEDAKKVGKLPQNAGCHIYEIKDGWAKIVSGKVTGYVKSEYLVTDAAAEEYALEVGTKVVSVKIDGLHARFAPTIQSAVYSQIGQEDFDIVKENLTEDYVRTFLQKNLTGDDARLIANVDMDDMIRNLDQWICIRIDDDTVFVSKEYVDISYQLKKAVPFEELSADGSSGVSSVRAQMVQFAMQYLGNRYVFGGTSLTGGIDCSAFMMRIYQHFGYNGIPRNSAAQAAYCRSISYSEIKPGDLLFYERGGRIGHVGMYIGNGQIIHASSAKTGIKISNAYYKTPLKIGRIIND